MIKAWWIGRIRFVWFSNTAYVLRSTFKSKTHTFLSSMLHVFTLFFKNSMNDIWLSIYEYSMNDYLFPAHIVVYPVNSWNIAKTIKFIAFQVFLLQRNIGGGGQGLFGKIEECLMRDIARELLSDLTVLLSDSKHYHLNQLGYSV